MKTSLQRIKELLPKLPNKDAKIAENFLNSRNFEGILELVVSDIYKIQRDSIEDDFISDQESALTELKTELLTYMSYLDIPDDELNYDYY